MTSRNNGKAQIKIALLAITLFAAAMLAIASINHQPNPLEHSHHLTENRELNCFLLYVNMNAAFDRALQTANSENDDARQALEHVARLYNGHEFNTSYFPGIRDGIMQPAITADELNYAYRQCAKAMG